MFSHHLKVLNFFFAATVKVTAESILLNFITLQQASRNIVYFVVISHLNQISDFSIILEALDIPSNVTQNETVIELEVSPSYYCDYPHITPRQISKWKNNPDFELLSCWQALG